jgi:hypothetical protein
MENINTTGANQYVGNGRLYFITAKQLAFLNIKIYLRIHRVARI